MKSFLTGLCLLMALLGGAGTVLAKDSTTKTTATSKADFKNVTVNLNKADENTLSYYLKGVGPAKAKAIIDYRTKNGNFSSIDDLLKVSGIGEATFKGLKSNVSLSRGETTAPKTANTSSSKKATNSSSTSSDKSTGNSPLKAKSSKDTSATQKPKAKPKNTETTSKASKKKEKADAKCKVTNGKLPKDCKPKKPKSAKTKPTKKKASDSKKTNSKTDKK